MKNITTSLSALYNEYFGVAPDVITPLPQGGSDRKYFRLSAEDKSAVGAYNTDIQENRTFIYFTNHFYEKGIPVPQVLAVSPDEKFYLLTDLGNSSLLQHIENMDWSDAEQQVLLLEKTLKLLAQVQVEGAKGLDFSKCFQKSEFDLQSIMWDFYYFKYCFLKPIGFRFNEAQLDADFKTMGEMLLQQPVKYFHYRDFQSRNVMLFDGEPYFIDYQGGRKGPLLYDVASFLYQAKANLPEGVRMHLFDYYLSEVSQITEIDKGQSKEIFPAFVLFRIIQTFGAYGFRGFFERRPHFLQSIPLAAKNLKLLLTNSCDLFKGIPTLKTICEGIVDRFQESSEQRVFKRLSVQVASFSYKKGYPAEHPEHGGGFVFDCRGLPNPGRINKYKMLNGNDKSVVLYLEEHKEVDEFFNHALGMVQATVQTYYSRGFKHLSVSFGCTGGQHRSVYMANRMVTALQKDGRFAVTLNHRELNAYKGLKE
ncbi:MAG TPA: RNase adapter RapZ [Perlabentimonas sp.]|nr:RNase adapter RapZ [Perlabentimonas sp.]